MTIAGQLTVTASDDPRFAAGDSIGLVIDAGLTLSVTQALEVSAPFAETSSAERPASRPSTTSEDVSTSEVATGDSPAAATA